MYCDKFTVVFFSKNDKYSKGVKHMELKYFSVKEEVKKQRVSIEHISTNPWAFFNSSSPILLEPFAYGSGDWSLPREDCIIPSPLKRI